MGALQTQTIQSRTVKQPPNTVMPAERSGCNHDARLVAGFAEPVRVSIRGVSNREYARLSATGREVVHAIA